MTEQLQVNASEPIALLAVLRTAEAESDLKAAARGLTGIRVESRIGRLEDLDTKIVELRPPGVLLLDVDLDDPSEMALLMRVLQKHAGIVPVVVTAANISVDGLRRLMRIGVPDVLPQPITGADLLAALEAVVERSNTESQITRRTSRVFSLIKPRGGLGATTLAVQMAHALASNRRKKKEVCVLDLDIQYGNVALYMDLRPRHSLLDILESPDRLDGSFLRGLVSRHKSGIDILSAPPQPISLDSVTPEIVTRLIELASAQYDYVMIDLPFAWTRWTKAALGHSDMIVQVVQMSVPALRQARQQLDMLQEQGLGQIPTVVLANRHERHFMFGKRGISKSEAEEALGRPIGFAIDNDFKTVSEAVNQGIPIREIRRRTTVEKQINEFIDSSLKLLAEDPVSRRKGI